MRTTTMFIGLMLAVSTGCGGGAGGGRAALVGYRVGPQPTQLVLRVETGPGDKLLGGKVLSQDGQAVTVEVRMKRAGGLQPAIAVPRDVTLELEEPLGQREVRAAPGGRPVPLLS